MQTMRESWTDERLDDLNAKVDLGFERMDRRFDRMEERFTRSDARFDRMEERFESMYRLMLTLGGGGFVALIGLIATKL